jgi:signal transduction histidine kinase
MYSSPTSEKQSFWRFALVAGSIVVITLLHYTIDLRAGAVHDVLLRSYYVPIVLAGLWYGARGGLAAAFAVSIVFLPHAMHGWDAPYTSIFRLIEILMYYVIGGLTGWLSSRTRLALEAEKQAGLDRERAHEGLKKKTTELFEMEEELRRSERLAALGRMSGGLAHEIRNPLASIKTSVEMLQEQCEERLAKPPSDSSIDLLAVVSEETDRLNRILTEFLQFARAEAQLDDGAPATCVLGDVLSRTIELLRRDLAAGSVTVESDADEPGVSVLVGEDHLRQILLNLFLNAAEAMPEGGVIRVRLIEENGDDITLAVEDTGAGISREVARSLFDPFFSTKEGGTGLGLSIVARLLDASGGSIKLDQSMTIGARFLVTLPMADPS